MAANIVVHPGTCRCPCCNNQLWTCKHDHDVLTLASPPPTLNLIASTTCNGPSVRLTFTLATWLP